MLLSEDLLDLLASIVVQLDDLFVGSIEGAVFRFLVSGIIGTDGISQIAESLVFIEKMIHLLCEELELIVLHTFHRAKKQMDLLFCHMLVDVDLLGTSTALGRKFLSAYLRRQPETHSKENDSQSLKARAVH